MKGLFDAGRLTVIVSFLSAVFLLAGVALAQPGSPKLVLKTAAEKEVQVKKDGKIQVTRVPADRAHPGDVVVYTITYENAGKGPVLDAEIVDPIPQGVVYLLNSAEGKDAEITCSIDGGRTWLKPPVMMQVRKPDGSLESQPAPPERYTHIRWLIKKSVAPGQTGKVSFKVTVK